MGTTEVHSDELLPRILTVKDRSGRTLPGTTTVELARVALQIGVRIGTPHGTAEIIGFRNGKVSVQLI